MIIEYDAENVFTKQIDLDDPGNCAIKCVSGDVNEYYLLIRTVFGKTYVLKYGPVLADLGIITDFFNLSFKKFDYKETKIQKEIENLLQDEGKAITEAEEITIEDALKDFPDIAESFLSVGGD